jgi:hypothetical protein
VVVVAVAVMAGLAQLAVVVAIRLLLYLLVRARL